MVMDNKIHIVRAIKGGGPNIPLKRLAVMALAFMSLFKDLLELCSLGFLTTDLYEHHLYKSDMLDRWWWQGG